MAAELRRDQLDNNNKSTDLPLNEADFDGLFNGNEEQRHSRNDNRKNSTPSFVIHIKKTYVEEIDVIAMSDDPNDRRHFRSEPRFDKPTCDASYQFQDPEELIIIREPDDNDDCIVPTTPKEEEPGPKLTFVFPKRSLFDIMDVSEPGQHPAFPVVVPQKQSKRPKLALTWPESEITFETLTSTMINSEKLKNLVEKTLVEYPGTFPDLNDEVSVPESILGDPEVDLGPKFDGIGSKRDTMSVAVDYNQEVPSLTIELPLLKDTGEEFYEDQAELKKKNDEKVKVTSDKKRSEVCIGESFVTTGSRNVKPIRVGLSRKQPVQPLHTTVRKYEF